MQCENCGVELVAGSAFCASCGRAVSHDRADSTSGGASKTAMRRGVAAALCYLAGLLTGIVFLLVEPYRRDSFVRFHAFQAIFLSVAWILIHFALAGLIAIVPWTLWRLIATVSSLVSFALVAVSLLLIYKAWKHERFKLPLIGDLAEKRA